MLNIIVSPEAEFHGIAAIIKIVSPYNADPMVRDEITIKAQCRIMAATSLSAFRRIRGLRF
jgi:hypothetical protein